MLYKSSYFKKELKGAAYSGQASIKSIAILVLFLSLITFVAHMILQTLYNTILTELFPQIMEHSYFSVAYLYGFFSVLLFAGCFVYYRKYFTFSEIHDNRWYALVKNGYKPQTMVTSKITARLAFIAIVYSLGFVLTMLLTVFLKYDFNILNIIALFFSGLVDVLFAAFCIMALSLLTNRASYLKLFAVFIVVFEYVFKILTNYNQVHGDEEIMKNILRLLSTPYFLTVLAASIGIAVLCYFKAKDLSNYYTPAPITKPNVIIKDFKTDSYIVQYKSKGYGAKVGKITANVIMSLFIAVCLLFNLLLIFISLSSSATRLLFGDNVPVLYQYDVMYPQIRKNDIALFRSADETYVPKEGDIVLFAAKTGENDIKIITGIDGDRINVAYLNATTTENTVISRNMIVGVHVSNNRGLGAFLVFTGSFTGRVVLLVIPVLWLFFGDFVLSKIRKQSAKTKSAKNACAVDRDKIDVGNLREL